MLFDTFAYPWRSKILPPGTRGLVEIPWKVNVVFVYLLWLDWCPPQSLAGIFI